VRQLAEGYAERDESIPVEELLELYDSHGIQPDMVQEIAEDVGASVAIPEDFYRLVAERHADEDEATKTGATRHDGPLAEVPKTDRLYYDDPEGIEFEAVVLDVLERDSADGTGGEGTGADGDGEYYDVVLDQTLFYPEGGGQPPDHGTLTAPDGTIPVTDVQVREGVVYHRTTEDPGTGEIVRGRIDPARRRRLMAHHTATHIVIHAARQVLGEHVRQAGAQKGVDRSRIDLRHYDRISREQVKAIERLANEIVRRNVPVRQEWPDRNAAEAEHGFDLYQGGVPPGTDIRLIHVAEDVQACGGTHVGATGDVGAIKVLNTTRVQDGVERLSFAAGEAAIDATQGTEDALYEAAEVLGDIDPAEVPEAAGRFFEEWKARGKRIEGLNEQLAEARVGGDGGEEVEIGETVAVLSRIDSGIEELRATANAIVGEGEIAVLASAAGDSAQFVVAVPENVEVNAGAVVSELASKVGGGGGGPPDFAQGGGPESEKLDDALDDAPDVLRQLNA
jgi:alanyl-tRNA synthetase